MTKTKKASKQELEGALRYYIQHHLKPGDLEAVPELAAYLAKRK